MVSNSRFFRPKGKVHIKLLLAGIILYFTIGYSPYVYGGAWTVSKNHLWMEFYNKWEFANDKFDNDWDRIPLGWDPANAVDKGAEQWMYDFEWKIEYGLADWLNFLYSMSFEESNYKEHSRPAGWGDYSRKSRGLKYVRIGGKGRFIEDPVVFSMQLVGYLHGPNDEKHEPALGRGDDKLETKLLFGKSFMLGKLPSYAGLETGYRYRSDEVADDIPLFFEIGVTLFEWLMVRGEMDSWWSIEGTGDDREDYGKIRGGIVFSPSGQFSLFRAPSNYYNIELQGGYTLWGKNTSASWEIVVKIQTQIDIPDFLNRLEKRHKKELKKL